MWTKKTLNYETQLDKAKKKGGGVERLVATRDFK